VRVDSYYVLRWSPKDVLVEDFCRVFDSFVLAHNLLYADVFDDYKFVSEVDFTEIQGLLEPEAEFQSGFISNVSEAPGLFNETLRNVNSIASELKSNPSISNLFGKLDTTLTSVDSIVKNLEGVSEKVSSTSDMFSNTINFIIDSLGNLKDLLVNNVQYILPVLCAASIAWYYCSPSSTSRLITECVLCFSVGYGTCAGFNALFPEVFANEEVITQSGSNPLAAVANLLLTCFNINCDKGIGGLIDTLSKAGATNRGIESLFANAYEIINYILSLVPKYVSNISFSEPQFLAFKKECDFLEVSSKDGTLFATPMNIERIKNVIDTGNRLALHYSRTSAGVLGNACTHITTRLATLLAKLMCVNGVSAFRAEPVCVALFGKPGVGKTNATHAIVETFFKKTMTKEQFEAYEASRSEYQYNRTLDKHWEGCSPSTQGVMFDDFAQNRDVPGGDTSHYSDLIGVKNGHPFFPPMAFEMKGKVSIEPRVITISSNLNSINPLSIMSPQAIIRRLDFPYLLRLKDGPEYSTKGHEEFKPDHTRWEFIPVTFDSQNQIVPGGEPLSFDQVISKMIKKREEFIFKADKWKQHFAELRSNDYDLAENAVSDEDILTANEASEYQSCCGDDTVSPAVSVHPMMVHDDPDIDEMEVLSDVPDILVPYYKRCLYAWLKSKPGQLVKWMEASLRSRWQLLKRLTPKFEMPKFHFISKPFHDLVQGFVAVDWIRISKLAACFASCMGVGAILVSGLMQMFGIPFAETQSTPLKGKPRPNNDRAS